MLLYDRGKGVMTLTMPFRCTLRNNPVLLQNRIRVFWADPIWLSPHAGSQDLGRSGVELLPEQGILSHELGFAVAQVGGHDHHSHHHVFIPKIHFSLRVLKI